MHRDKHFTDYARKVAEADAGKTIGSSEAPGLPQTPHVDAAKKTGAPHRQVKLTRTGGWIDDESPYLDSERRNRDFGGYRAAIGDYADPARHDEQAPGTLDPGGDVAKP